MSDKEFPQGIRVKAPHEKSPEFVKGQISIRVAEFQEWLSKQPNEWVNLDIKQARTGNYYVELDSFEPKGNATPKPEPAKAASDDDDLPF